MIFIFGNNWIRMKSNSLNENSKVWLTNLTAATELMIILVWCIFVVLWSYKRFACERATSNYSVFWNKILWCTRATEYHHHPRVDAKQLIFTINIQRWKEIFCCFFFCTIKYWWSREKYFDLNACSVNACRKEWNAKLFIIWHEIFMLELVKNSLSIFFPFSESIGLSNDLLMAGYVELTLRAFYIAYL
jgi:hypothetical protein